MFSDKCGDTLLMNHIGTIAHFLKPWERCLNLFPLIAFRVFQKMVTSLGFTLFHITSDDQLM
jgi:hypothetical protein